MDQEFVKKVKSCDKRQSNHRAPAEAPLHPWEWLGLPWWKLHIAYAGREKCSLQSWMHTRSGCKCMKHRMKSITSTTTIEKLRCLLHMVYPQHSLATMVTILPAHNSRSSWKRMESSTSQWHLIILPQTAWQRGLCESLKKAMRRWRMGVSKTKLSRFFLSYCTIPHSTTGVPPAELHMKRRLHTHLNRIGLFHAQQIVLGLNSPSRRQHMITMLRRRRFYRARLFMLRISGTRAAGCQELSWRKLVQCQLKFSWTTGQSCRGTKTMFNGVRMMW